MDFDGTLCENAYPLIGAPRLEVIEALKEAKSAGAKIILWTCRSGERLKEAVAWCKEKRINFDIINDNIPEREKLYGGKTRKVSADEYWDDKAIRV